MRYFLLLIGLLVLTSLVTAQTRTPGPDWSHPETIDPFQPGLGEVLDLNLASIVAKGDSCYQARDYTNAARHYLLYLQHDTQNGGAIYNLACCYGLMKKPDLAAAYLRRSWKAGYHNLSHIEEDSDFEAVRKEPSFMAVMDTLRSWAGEIQPAGQVLYLTGTALFPCRVMLPANYQPNTAYRMVIGLHGFGSSMDNFAKLWKGLDTTSTIYAIPEGQYPMWDGGKEPSVSWEPLVEDSLLTPAQWKLTSEWVVAVTESLIRKYKPSDVYLMGFSQGCHLTYQVGLANPNYYKGLICWGGWLDEEKLGEETLKKARDLRIFVGQGTEDNVIKPEAARHATEILKNLGFEVTNFDFPGGHRVPKEGLEKVVTWMAQGN